MEINKNNDLYKIVSLRITFCFVLIGIFFNSDAKNKYDKPESVIYKVTFNLNYSCPDTIPSVSVKENGMLTAEQEIIPQRPGYRFAGWYTCKNPILNNGFSEDEWIFGETIMFNYGKAVGGYNYMPVTNDITLYARWVQPKEIYTIQDLQNIKNDLKGWYILKNNIDLRNLDWIPIGVYENSYEFSNPNWWKLAFRGLFDGNNYTIKNLTIKKPMNTAALFGAVSNAEIKDLKISNYSISYELFDSNDMVASFVYAAPLVGFMHGKSVINNCHSNGSLQIKITDSNSDMTFTSVAGLIAGAWGGAVRNCSTEGNISFSSVSNNGGECYVAGLTGEGYNATVNCRTEVNIDCESVSKATPISIGDGKDKHFDLYIGGVNGGSTSMSNCYSKGTICVSLKKDEGEANIYVGGISGSHRYGAIEYCRSDCNITIEDGKSMYAGGILGGFNGQYGMIGYLMGERRFEITNSLVAGKISFSDKLNPVKPEIHLGAIAGEIPEKLKSDWMPNAKIAANYKVEDCVFLDVYDGLTLADSNATISGIQSVKHMKGIFLKTILGEQNWNFKKNKVPFPNFNNPK